jgi:hypothetical protein
MPRSSLSSPDPAAVELREALLAQARDLRVRSAQLHNAAHVRGTDGRLAALVGDTLATHAALIEHASDAAWRKVFGARLPEIGR